MATRSVRDSLKPTAANASKALQDLAGLSAKAALANTPKLVAVKPLVTGTWSVKTEVAGGKQVPISKAVTKRTINQIDFSEVVDNLPSTCYGLLEVAIRDLKAAEAVGLNIDMGSWVQNIGDKKACSVCMAGSVIAGTLGVPVLDEMENVDDDSQVVEIEPHDFSDEIREKLETINSLRTGDINDAIRCLYGDETLDVDDTVFQKWFKAARKNPKLKAAVYRGLDDEDDEVDILVSSIELYAQGTYNKIQEYSNSRVIFYNQMARLLEILTELKI